MFNELRNYSRIIVYVVVVAFVISGGFMGYGALFGGNGGGQQPGEQPDIDDAIVTVNDHEIPRQQYLNVLDNYRQQTANFTRSQMLPFRLSILESLIEESLLFQEAENRGISPEVSEVEIEEYIEQILEQNQMEMEELEEVMEMQGLTMDQLRQSLRQSLEQQAMIEEVIADIEGEVSVSEEEIEERFAELYGEEDLSEDEAEEAREEIKADLTAEKEEEVFASWLEEKWETADIEIKDNSLQALKYLEQGQFTEARELFYQELEYSTDSALYIFLAETYQEEELYDEAEEVLLEALEVDPENWELAYHLGEHYRLTEDDEKALEMFDQASEYAGQNLMARYQLNLAYTQLEAEDRAAEEMDEFIELQEEYQEVGAQEGMAPLPEEEEMEEEDIEELEEEMQEEVEDLAPEGESEEPLEETEPIE